jgi:hypothetical protein
MRWSQVALIGLIIGSLGAAVLIWERWGDDPAVGVLPGSGTIVAERRAVAGFDAIDFAAAGTVLVSQGSEESLTIETDDNVLPLVRSEVRGATLRVWFANDESNRSPRPTRLVATVGMRTLSSLTVSGAAQVESTAIETERLTLTISGTATVVLTGIAARELRFIGLGMSNVTLAGIVGTQQIELNGTGSYRATDLACNEVDVSLNGVGEIAVRVAERLNVEIAGSGAVTYVGEPTVTERISGTGTVGRIAEESDR